MKCLNIYGKYSTYLLFPCKWFWVLNHQKLERKYEVTFAFLLFYQCMLRDLTRNEKQWDWWTEMKKKEKWKFFGSPRIIWTIQMILSPVEFSVLFGAKYNCLWLIYTKIVEGCVNVNVGIYIFDIFWACFLSWLNILGNS